MQHMGLVEELSPDLTGNQRRHLRSLAHSLKPVVLVGQRGVSDPLIENLDQQLLAHELVKVKVHGGDEIEEVARQLHEGVEAALVQWIGNMLVYYRPHPEKPTIHLPQ
jgi:RNA-binding protein